MLLDACWGSSPCHAPLRIVARSLLPGVRPKSDRFREDIVISDPYPPPCRSWENNQAKEYGLLCSLTTGYST